MKAICLTRLLIIGQFMALSACDQGRTSVSPVLNDLSSPNSTSESSMLGAKSFRSWRTDPNQDSSIWANVTHEDFADQASQLAIVSRNNSHYSLEAVGCDQRAYLTNKLLDIAVGYQFPLTKRYEPRWQFLDALKSGIFDPAQIGSNGLLFSHTPATDQFNCYYRVLVPEAHASLYLKLVNTIYTASSYSPSGNPVLNRPQADKLLAAQSSSWQEIAGETFMDVMAGTLSYSAIVRHYPDFDPVFYLQTQMETAMQAWSGQITQLLAEYRLVMLGPDNATNVAEYRKAIQNLLGLDDQGNGVANRYFRLTERMRFFREAVLRNSDYLSGVRYDGENNRLLLEYRDSNGALLAPREITLNSDLVRGEPLPNPLAEIERLGLRDDPKVFLKLFGRGKYAGSDSEFADIIDLERMGLDSDEIISFGAANTAIDMATLGCSSGLTVTYIILQYYLIQPLINGIFDQPAVGTFTTGINHLQFAEVSADDASSWNQTHDKAQQIAANTKLTPVANNSLFQYVKFSFSDPNIDSQFNLAITLASLTTPWTRYTSYDPFADNRDPYLGCVDKNGHCNDGTASHKADAVVSMTISDNRPKPGKDLDSLYSLALYHDSGLEQLARDRLLPAPVYSGGDLVTNLAANPQIIRRPADLGLTISRASQIKSDGLASAPPIVLNSGQALTLTVSLPSGSSGSVANVAGESLSSVYGGGFAVSYSEPQFESTPSKFMLFNNSVAAEEISQKSSPAINVLIAKFVCPFPLPVGLGCQLQLAMPGASDGRHHQGQLLIADANSRTLALPLYLNYRLISQPAVFNVSLGDYQSNFRLQISNAGAKRYARLRLDGLPKGSQISRNGCTRGLDSGSSCQMEFNFGRVDVAGKYQVTIRAISGEGSSTEADQSQLTLDISPGFKLARSGLVTKQRKSKCKLN